MLVILIPPKRKSTNAFYLQPLNYIFLMICKSQNQVLVKYIFIFAVHLLSQHILTIEHVL